MLTSIDPADRLAYVSGFLQSTIFHHPAWSDLLADCYGYRAEFLLFQDGGHAMSVGLPVMRFNTYLGRRRATALPFSDFCTPLGVKDEQAMKALVRALHGWRRSHHLAQLEVRWQLPSQEGVYSGESYLQHCTPLSRDQDRVFASFKKTRVQRHIRQAEKLGVTTRLGTSWDDMLRFYGLHLHTRRRLGVPVQPRRFFGLLWERLLQKGLGFVLLAYRDDQLLAGALFLHFNQTVTYKFGASVPAYWKLRPNDLLFWHAIGWGCQNGFRVFDWGRTDPVNIGLRDFKRGWGSEERVVGYSILADRPPARNPVLMKALPLMKAIIQRAPPWVCRLSGELFYGQAA